MVSTTRVDTNMSARAIGARTNFAGTGVTDLTAEEDRFDHVFWENGVIGTSDEAFEVVAGSAATMNVVVGSTGSKNDYAVLVGTNAGQGAYIARMDDATKTQALSAADPSNPRKDEVYLVVEDDAYDSSGTALPILAIREGDAAASPSAPGADAAWDAYLLLATVDIPASAADILACTITDERAWTYLQIGNQRILQRTPGIGTEVRAASGEEVILKVAAVSEFEVSSTQVDFKSNALVNVATIDGTDPTDWSLDTHNHDSDYGGLTGPNAWSGTQDFGGQVTVDTGVAEAIVIEREVGEARIIQWENAATVEVGHMGMDTSENLEVVAAAGDLELVSSSGSVKAGGNRVLTTADEGTGNGLDADTLDTYEATDFARLAGGGTFSAEVKAGADITYPLIMVREPAEARHIRWENNAGSSAYGYIGIHSNGNLNIYNLEPDADIALLTSGTGEVTYNGVEVATSTVTTGLSADIAANGVDITALEDGRLETVNGLAGTSVTAGTGAPSGGVNGDIHLQYA